MKAPELNIIGDVSGLFDSLMALLEKMPKTAKTVLLGDMVDRGPKSKQVLEWGRENALCLKGNHEHMMVDAIRDGGFYEARWWVENLGGFDTLFSFGAAVSQGSMYGTMIQVDMDRVPKDLIQWIDDLPLYREYDDLFLSHAPFCQCRGLASVSDPGTIGFEASRNGFGGYKETMRINDGLLWYRGEPTVLEGKLQAFGHNYKRNATWYYGKGGKKYAVCLDSSHGHKLTGMHWPSMEIFEQKWVEFTEEQIYEL